jgi:antitoxin MazE
MPSLLCFAAVNVACSLLQSVNLGIVDGATLTARSLRNYNAAMKTRIVKIGNSQGIRIPKSLLERSKIGEEVELEAEDNRIIIRSAKRPRQGWEAAFRAMAERGDDALLDK